MKCHYQDSIMRFIPKEKSPGKKYNNKEPGSEKMATTNQPVAQNSSKARDYKDSVFRNTKGLILFPISQSNSKGLTSIAFIIFNQTKSRQMLSKLVPVSTSKS